MVQKGLDPDAPNNSASKPPLSPAEKGAFQAFKDKQESGSKLIRKEEAARPKKRPRKAAPAKPTAPAVEQALSRPTQGLTEVRQAQRHGRSRKVAVEFVSKGRSGPS